MAARKFTILGSLPLLALGAFAAEKKAVTAPGIPPSPNFSHGISFGDTLYVSGQVGRGTDGKRPEKFEDEVKATLDAVSAILKAGGADFKDVAMVNVYLTDMSLFDQMNKVYISYFPEPRPTRTTVGVAKLVGDFRIEITVTARLAGTGGGKKNKRR